MRSRSRKRRKGEEGRGRRGRVEEGEGRLAGGEEWDEEEGKGGGW